MRHRIFVYTDRSTQMPTAILDINGNVVASANRHGDYQHSIGELLLRQREVRLESMADGSQRARIACMNGGKAALIPRIDTLLSSRSLSLRCEPQVLQPNAEGYIVISYDPVANPRQEVLRRKAEELAQAEEGLEDPHAFSRTRTYVLLALVLLVVAFAVYTFAMHA
jgi:hypothetical protein